MDAPIILSPKDNHQEPHILRMTREPENVVEATTIRNEEVPEKSEGINMDELVNDYSKKWEGRQHVSDKTEKITISDNMSDGDILELSEELSCDDAYCLGKHLGVPDGLLRTWCCYDGGKCRWPWDVYQKWRQSHTVSNKQQLTDELMTALRSIGLEEKANDVSQKLSAGNISHDSMFIDIYEDLINERKWYSLGEKLGLKKSFLDTIDVCNQHTTPLSSAACRVLQFWKQMRLGKDKLVNGLKRIGYADPNVQDNTARLIIDIEQPGQSELEAEIFLQAMKELIIGEWEKKRSLKNGMRLRSTVHVLEHKDWVIESIKDGSIIIEIRCTTLEALDDLKKMVQSGDLAKRLQQDYLTPNLQEKFNLEGCVLKVNIETSSNDSDTGDENGNSEVTRSLVVKRKSRSQEVCQKQGLTDVNIPDNDSLKEFIKTASAKIKQVNADIKDEQLMELLRAKLDDMTNPGVEVEWNLETGEAESESHEVSAKQVDSLSEQLEETKISTITINVKAKLDVVGKFEVSSDDDVKSLKEKIRQLEGVSFEEIGLYYLRNALNDEDILSMYEMTDEDPWSVYKMKDGDLLSIYNMYNGCDVHVIPLKKEDTKKGNELESKQPSGYIIVRTVPMGETFEINCDRFKPVAELMAKIEQKVGIPAYRQRLMYCQKQIEPDRTLSDYNIKNGASLHVGLKLSSSGPQQSPKNPFKKLISKASKTKSSPSPESLMQALKKDIEGQKINRSISKFSESFTIKVREKKGVDRVRELEVSMDDNVKSVKEKIAKMGGVSCDELTLSCDGKLLSDELQMRTFKMREASHGSKSQNDFFYEVGYKSRSKANLDHQIVSRLQDLDSAVGEDNNNY